MIDRKTFFAGIRQGPFPGKLTAEQVSGASAILDEWERGDDDDLRRLAYILATTYHETAHTMQPIREYGRGKGRKYGVADAVTGKVYYERGYVQLTWKTNYAAMAKITGVDLVNKPDLALDPDTAATIMFEGMYRGTFTGKKLANYFSAKVDDPVGARKIINGTDRAALIAGYHAQFLADLRAATR